jgi:hypothetical protein
MSRRIPTKRVALDGKCWRVKLQRPPDREPVDGLCVRDDRSVYIHPDAIAHRGKELVIHELLHARFWDIEEDAIAEVSLVIAEVMDWVERKNDGVIG